MNEADEMYSHEERSRAFCVVNKHLLIARKPTEFWFVRSVDGLLKWILRQWKVTLMMNHYLRKLRVKMRDVLRQPEGFLRESENTREGKCN